LQTTSFGQLPGSFPVFSVIADAANIQPSIKNKDVKFHCFSLAFFDDSAGSASIYSYQAYVQHSLPVFKHSPSQRHRNQAEPASSYSELHAS
jgi:hypothetical protein